jgi:expansin (peptidoglycan-binding protein)
MKRFTLLTIAVICLSFANSVCLIGSGDGTYYDDAGYGACGTYITAGDDSIALNAPQFDPYTPSGNPNRNSLCGQRVIISGPKGTVNGTIRDRCPVCKSGAVDMRSHLFSQIADISAGRVQVSWKFIDC